MPWTYDENPGTSTAAERRDSVRLLVGDTNTNDQQLQDAEIVFALGQSNDDVYSAAAICAQSLAGKFARETDVSFDGVSDKFGDRSEHYRKLATTLRQDAKRYGAGGLGVPAAGGISESAMQSADEDADRVPPKFKQDQFANPSEDDTWPSAT